MRKLGVFTALALGGMTASCAERMVNPAVAPKPPPQKIVPKLRTNPVGVRRQAETMTEDARKRAALHSSQANLSAGVRPEQPHEPQAPLPRVSQQPKDTSISPDRPMVAARPPPSEPAEPSFPVAALMPPPPEPAEPTFPSTPLAIGLPSPSEPPTSILPEVSPEAAMPPPPDPAEPSFPVATLMSLPPEPAEPSLTQYSQEQIAAESPISIPLPDLPSYLSLRPRFDWVDTVGAIEVSRGLLSETLEANAEEQIPSLIRNPWPLSIDVP
jgi:hypothetical protein